jgi:cell wall-active antibiotic response 4TMS protein YvqF/uncharacterized protein DUF1707
MHGEQHPKHVSLRRAREAALTHLSEAFALDQVSLEQFEERVARAYACREESQLLPLVEDLGPLRASTLARTPPTEPTQLARDSSPSPPGRLALAVFGSVEQRTQGAIADGQRVLAVFGNVELDLRELVLPPGVTELHVRAVFGNVEITVPATLAVECRGTPVFGSFANLARLPAVPAGEAILRIVGSAVFGNVEVRTRPQRTLLS